MSAAPGAGVVLAAPSDRAAALPGLTVIETGLLLAPLMVTATDAVSALYSFITPLLEPATDAIPLKKEREVADPNWIAVPELLETVGLLEPTACGPLNVAEIDPVMGFV